MNISLQCRHVDASQHHCLVGLLFGGGRVRSLHMVQQRLHGAVEGSVVAVDQVGRHGWTQPMEARFRLWR